MKLYFSGYMEIVKQDELKGRKPRYKGTAVRPARRESSA